MMCEFFKKLSIAIIDLWYEVEECQCKCCMRSNQTESAKKAK